MTGKACALVSLSILENLSLTYVANACAARHTVGITHAQGYPAQLGMMITKVLDYVVSSIKSRKLPQQLTPLLCPLLPDSILQKFRTALHLDSADGRHTSS